MLPEFLTRAELFAQGHTRRSISTAVKVGVLLHVRRDRYLPIDSDDAITKCVRVGGRLTCLSLLEAVGVFVLTNTMLHVHVNPAASRLRSPHSRKKRIDRTHRRGVRLHWSELSETPGSTCLVHVVDALAHSVRCQPPRAAIATLDSAIQTGLISRAQLADIFRGLPRRYQSLRNFIDGRAESGPESLVRIMARMLNCDVRLQVVFDGIGRVDLLLDDWLVVECDSKQFHSDWESQVRDRERDLKLASLGYATLRLTGAAIMYRPDEVFEALRGLILSRRTA